ncbi:MAG: phosphoribosylamine--glycine ligase [Bacillota bacterium]
MRVLIVGGGGREHALAWKLSQSPLLKELYCAPGNAGIAAVAECLELEAGGDRGPALLRWALDQQIDLTVIGPEAPLAAGLADDFRRAGLRVFGPGRDGARLESSKVWAKERMVEWGIPTANYAAFDRYDAACRYLDDLPEGPLVVKADGLAAGKGVTVARGAAEAKAALQAIMVDGVFGRAGEKVITEECLAGEEVSVLAVTDGKELVLLPSAQDHKAIGEGDLGPNTGGMGAYAPAPVLTADLRLRVEQAVFRPLLKGLAGLGIDYRGVLYAGLMIKDGTFNVLEFNARFGDPETQAVLPLLQSDLLPLLLAAADGDLAGVQVNWSEGAAVCVIMASAGYPGPYEQGLLISGLDEPSLYTEGLTVFHAGTAFQHGNIVTAGGRVLGLAAWDSDLETAVQKVYAAAPRIAFPGCYYRRDIAHRALR